MTKPHLVGLAAILGGLLLTLFINYHSFLANFNLVPGDQGDTRLVVFTLEHWFSALKGQEAPLQLNMFYPDKLALGYADGLFLFAIPYAGFRALGLDSFSSYELVLIVLTAFGFGMYLLLLRRALKLQLGFAVAASILLTSLNSMQLQVDIGKLLAFYFWPALILMLYLYAGSYRTGRWRPWLSLAGFSVLLGLLFFTSYYPAWYFVFTALLFGLAYFGIEAWRSGFTLTARGVLVFLRKSKIQILVALAVLIISLIPFWLTYAPLVFSSANRSFSLVLDFSPTIRDVINVSAFNYFWSPILAGLHFNFGNREVQLGSPLLILAVFGAFYARQVLAAIRSRSSDAASGQFILALATTAVLILVLIVKIRGVSAWYIVYRLVPGASALRAAGRYLMVIDMIVVAAVVYGLNQTYGFLRGRASGLGARLLNTGLVLVLGFLVAEQVNATTFRLDKAGQLAFLSSFQRPGSECRAFFISNPTQLNLPIGYYQLDAMMIGMKYGIPTVNGYSGIGPDPVFSMVPSGIEYEYGILNWLRATGADKGICELDYQTRAFAPIDVNAQYARYLQLVRTQYIQAYSTLFSAVASFILDKNDLANLYPQYLEQRGYLASSFGFQTGAAYRWIGNKYWIGTRACGKNECAAIGIVGSYVEIEDIIEGFGPRAAQMYFPLPQTFEAGRAVSPDTQGELLIVFPPAAFAE